MKLNLVPTTVSKSGQSKTFAFLGALIAIASVVLAVLLISKGRTDLDDARKDADTHRQGAADALATSKEADTIIASSTVIDRNLKLSEAMAKHNRDYVDLYRTVMKYVPDYYRLVNLSATPAGADSATVTLVGQLKTFQQYADLTLALWRIPDVVSVSRSGFILNSTAVPGLSAGDQVGTPIKPGDTPLPSDPVDKLDALAAKAAAAPSGYQGVGNFGDPAVTEKGAMPDWSTVTMTVTVKKDVQTPDPRATIMAQGAAGSTGAPAAGGGAGFNTVTNTTGAKTGGSSAKAAAD